MQIFYGPDAEYPAGHRGVALGFFDGLHRGHISLIRTLLYHCTLRQLPAAVFTFERHPDSVLHSEHCPDALYTLPERLELMAGLGLDEVYVYPFDQPFASLDPEVFLSQVVVSTLHASLVVVGPDYRFGAGKRGDVNLLRSFAEQNGIELIVANEICAGTKKIASSEIRHLIQDGEVAQAASFLGRPYTIQGIVTSGRGLGHQLGFPTANMFMPEGKVCPAFGVYATRARVVGKTWQGITSIGLRPTVSRGREETVPVIETYLYDYDANISLYGEKMTLELLSFIRPEHRFDSLLKLSSQVRADMEQVRLWHRKAEQCYEVMRVHEIPIRILYSDRFSQSHLHVVFQVKATPRQMAVNALLVQVLTATCRRYPERTKLALALDHLYGASFDGSVGKCGDVQTLIFSGIALARWDDQNYPFRSVCDLVFSALLEPDLEEDGLFRESIVESERNNLVLALMARENDKTLQAYDRCLELFCGGQVHGLNAMGRISDLRMVTREELHEAYETLLQQTSLSVYLGGQVDQEEIESVAECLRQFPLSNRPVYYPGRVPTPCRPEKEAAVTEHRTGEQARIVMAFSGLPPYFEPLSSAVLLNSMLGGDAHSLLFDVIREKMGLAYLTFSVFLPYLSALFVIAGVAPSDVDRTIVAIKEQVSCLSEGRFDDALIHRSKRLLESSIRSIYDQLQSMLATQINNQLSGKYDSRDDALRLLSNLTKDQIVQMASRLDLKTTYILTPERRKSPAFQKGAKK